MQFPVTLHDLNQSYPALVPFSILRGVRGASMRRSIPGYRDLIARLGDGSSAAGPTSSPNSFEASRVVVPCAGSQSPFSPRQVRVSGVRRQRRSVSTAREPIFTKANDRLSRFVVATLSQGWVCFMSTSRRPANHRRIPAVDALEDRYLLAATAQSQGNRVAAAWHKYHEYVSELQRIELKSQATQDQSVALSDAARTLSSEASASGTPEVQARAIAATLQLDQAPLYGWLGESGWAEVRSRLTANLAPLQTPSSAIDQTIAAMQAVAGSAGVTSSDYQSLTARERSYARARSSARNTTSHFPDPETYYTQHLRGFFRGAAVSEKQAQASLDADLEAIEREANDTPAQSKVLRRDVQLLQQVGAATTSQAFAQFAGTFTAAFDNGAPDAAAQQSLGATFRIILGPNALPSTLNAADRLVADSPAFFLAAASSQANIRTITTDVLVLVAAGGGAAPNAYKIQIPRGAHGS